MNGLVFGPKKGVPKTLFLLRRDFIVMKFHILTLRKLFILTFLPKSFILTQFLGFFIRQILPGKGECYPFYIRVKSFKGKLQSSGQICLCPDYVLVPPAIKPKLIAEMKKVLATMHGQNPRNSSDYDGKIINQNHTRRLM